MIVIIYLIISLLLSFYFQLLERKFIVAS